MTRSHRAERGVGEAEQRDHVEPDLLHLTVDVELGERPKVPNPALFTRMSTGVLASPRTRFDRRDAVVGQEVGGQHIGVDAVRRSSSAAAPRDGRPSRATSTTSWPRAARPTAKARPMPADAPVTRATLIDCSREIQRRRDRRRVGVDRVTDLHFGDGTVGVLEPVAGHRAHRDIVGREQTVGRGRSSPATDAADAGSTKHPSSAATSGTPR